MDVKGMKNWPEWLKFILVGGTATVLHYGLYLLMKLWMPVNLAYTLGYLLSFVANFYLTAAFTFRKKATGGKAVGFGLAHGVNYLMHMGLLNLFLWVGIPSQWAPIPVFAIAVPVNFLLVRFVFKR